MTATQVASRQIADLLTNKTLVGYTLTGPAIVAGTAMAALAIDVTKPLNTKSISANSTMTFSATPAAGTWTDVKILADATDRVVTIPSCWSYSRNASITSVTVVASTTLSLSFYYTGARWEISGDPVETTGTGVYVLATSPTLVTPTLGTPASGNLSNCTFGSNIGVKSINLTAFDYTVDVTLGDGAAYFVIPSALNGMNLISCHAYVITAGTTGTTDIQIARIRSGTPVDMLSTKITIDSTETGSDTAATTPAINATNDDIATHDRIRIDVDATSTTKAKGLIVVLNFQLP